MVSGPINPDVSGQTPQVPTSSYVSGSVSVGTSATLVTTVPSGFVGGVVLQNGGADTVYVGGASVTDSTGLPVAAGASVTIPASPGVYPASVYAISATAGQNVTFLFGAPQP